MKINHTLYPELFNFPNVFTKMVICFFNDMIGYDQIKGGKIDIFQDEKILNIAYIDSQGIIIAQKNFNRKDIKTNEKS